MSSKKSPSKKQKKTKGLFSRRGYTLVLILAILILGVSIFTMTYSWYTPASQKGSGMSYNAEIKVRSEDCSLVGTFPATAENNRTMDKKTGELEYDDTASSNVTVPTQTATVDGETVVGQIYYFRTKISNNSVYPTNISLYLQQMPDQIDGATPGTSFAKFGLGVVTPSNSYHTFTQSQSDVCIIRNAYITGSEDEHYHDLYVDWFIKTTSSSVKIDFTKLYLRYN